MSDELYNAIHDAGLDAIMEILVGEHNADAIANSLWVCTAGDDTERLKKWIIGVLEEEMRI